MAESTELNEEESIQDENKFLKMKMMAENGAIFGDNFEEIDPHTENNFLKNIMEFEKKLEDRKSIKVGDWLKRPSQFLPADQVPDHLITQAWKNLSSYMRKRHIELSVCSPNVSDRELYRFTLEELFECEMDDMHMAGMVHCFIYDEFHPDPVYDNSRIATDDCIRYILDKDPLKWTHHFQEEGLRLNDHYPLAVNELKDLVNRFKSAYDDIELKEITDVHCIVNDRDSDVTGKYILTVDTGLESSQLKGAWKVHFLLDMDIGYWFINEVSIEHINF